MRVIYQEMMEKDHNKIKEEIKRMHVPKKVFYTNFNSKTRGIGFFYVVDEKNKLDKVSPLNYLTNVNGGYNKEFPTDAGFGEYKGRLTDKIKGKCRVHQLMS